MSNALGIAAVSAVLQGLLDEWLAGRELESSLGRVPVSALAPDLIELGTGKPGQLNLFLYHVTPNQGWSNLPPPARDSSFRLMTNPPLALDLHYLVTAYASKDFHAEILLGYAMQLLHETPVLLRGDIRRILKNLMPGDSLLASDLADQVEQIKISAQPLNTEELSKLWSAFQSRYRPTMAYQVSAVLIEGRRPLRVPLPALSTSAGDDGVDARTPAFATLSALQLPDRQPAARPGDVLTIQGDRLGGDRVEVRFASRLLERPISLSPQPGGTDTQLQVRLPEQVDGWVAGLYAVTVVVHRQGKADQVSNTLPVALAPRVESVVPARAGGAVTLRVTCSPPVLPEQDVALVLGQREILAEPRQAPTGNLSFVAAGQDVPPGDYLVRLRVDGVDSLRVDWTTRPPRFEPSQRVSIP
ncbi:MAG TPA: DUF4255 domain-containing protein [Roseiflexaceae bacterium]